MALFDALISPALKAVSDIIEQFHLSPEEKLQAQQAIADASDKARTAAFDYDVQLNAIAAKTIQTEESSGDKFTQRARPAFMYVIIAVLAFNYIGLPLAQIFGSKVLPIELPADLLTLFGVTICGYVTARSVDKALALPGESQVNLLGIVKVANKSPDTGIRP